MKQRLFSIEIVDANTVRLCFDAEISLHQLADWRQSLGEFIQVDMANE